MAYVVSSLGNYTNENADQLLYKTLAQGTTASLMTIQPGIKSAETINLVASRGVWQAGGTCGFNASGDTTFTQRTITIGKVKVNMKWCEADLEPKYTQKALAAGGSYDMLTYEQEIVGDITQNLSKDLENAIWKGDTASGSAYLSRFDGLCKIIAAGVGSGVVSASTVAWSVANSRTAFQNVYAALTDDMLANPTLKVFCGLSEARDYKMKLGIDNLYHITGMEGKLYLENTDVEIIPVLGLSGTKKVYAICTDNMFLGTDLMHEEEKFEIFYAKEADEIRFTSLFKYGVQVAFLDTIVSQINT